MAPRGPNLLFIVSDQHNPRVMGCAGDPVVATPGLDQLAARGTTLDALYCPSPLCAPSRMSLLTGLHPYETEVWTNENFINPGIPTFAHAMGAAGYRPYLVGKLHARGPDQLMGFVGREVGDHGPAWHGMPMRDAGVLKRTMGPFRVSLQRSGRGRTAYQYRDELAAAAAIHYIERHAADVRAGLEPPPFNLTVGLMLPHQPFVARPEDYGPYVDRVPPPGVQVPFGPELHPYELWWRTESDIEHVPADEVERARTAYYGMVTRLDAIVGSILDAVRSSGAEDDTLVIYTSDHGEMLGEHGLWWKQCLYDDSVRVPGIISWPGRIPTGARCGKVVSMLDLSATMLAALGAPPLPNSHGRDLLPVLTGESTEWDDVSFAEYCTDNGHAQRMVRAGRWKLIYHHQMPPQLFDLASDPYEERDLAAVPEHRETLERLRARVLADWEPEQVLASMGRKLDDLTVMSQWAANTRPDDPYLLPLPAELNALDNPAQP